MTKKPEPAVIHNRTGNRFEVVQKDLLAELDYILIVKTMIITHTRVPDALSGQGVGSRLARAALDFARSEGLQVESRCWFVSGFIERHPEYQDLLKKG